MISLVRRLPQRYMWLWCKNRFSDYRLFFLDYDDFISSSLTTALYVALNTGRLDG